MTLDRLALQREIHALYRAEHAALGEAGTLACLERAAQWDLAPVLRADWRFRKGWESLAEVRMLQLPDV